MFNIYLDDALRNNPLLLKTIRDRSVAGFADDLVFMLESELEAKLITQ